MASGVRSSCLPLQCVRRASYILGTGRVITRSLPPEGLFRARGSSARHTGLLLIRSALRFPTRNLPPHRRPVDGLGRGLPCISKDCTTTPENLFMGLGFECHVPRFPGTWSTTALPLEVGKRCAGGGGRRVGDSGSRDRALMKWQSEDQPSLRYPASERPERQEVERTFPARENDTTRNTDRNGCQTAATRRCTRQAERVTVQGPVKILRPDGVSCRGLGNGLTIPTPREPSSCHPFVVQGWARESAVQGP